MKRTEVKIIKADDGSVEVEGYVGDRLVITIWRNGVHRSRPLPLDLADATELVMLYSEAIATYQACVA